MASRSPKAADGFPFPIQPTPQGESDFAVEDLAHAESPATMYLEQSPRSIANSERSSFGGVPLPTRTAHVESLDISRTPTGTTSSSISMSGEVAGTKILRGGFGPPIKNALPPKSKSMFYYPPPPSAAYRLSSQLHQPSNATVTSKVLTPPIRTAIEDVSEAEDEDGGLYMPSRGTLAKVVKVMDGHQDEHDADRMPEGNRPEGKYKSINDYGYIPPPRQPLTLTVRSRPKRSDSEERFHTFNQPQKTRGEWLAETINFNRIPWVVTAPGMHGDFLTGSEQRADYIKTVDNIEAEDWEMDYCRVCGNDHIPPGAPLTLDDRDTCGAGVPDWFHIDRLDRPWHSFTKLLNEYVKLKEIQQGFTHKPNPDQPFWDLQFHEYSGKWKAIGKKGGWWKCRDGPGATNVEKTCRLCHSNVLEEDRAAHAVRRGKSVAKRLQNIQEYVNSRVKAVGERDKAVALATIHAEGFPEYLGPRTLDEVKFESHGLSRTPTMENLFSGGDDVHVDGDATPSGWGSPERGRSPPRGRSMVRRGSSDEGV